MATKRRRRARSIERRLGRIEAQLAALIAGQQQSPGPDWVAAMVREVVDSMSRERRRG